MISLGLCFITKIHVVSLNACGAIVSNDWICFRSEVENADREKQFQLLPIVLSVSTLTSKPYSGNCPFFCLLSPLTLSYAALNGTIASINIEDLRVTMIKLGYYPSRVTARPQCSDDFKWLEPRCLVISAAGLCHVFLNFKGFRLQHSRKDIHARMQHQTRDPIRS